MIISRRAFIALERSLRDHKPQRRPPPNTKPKTRKATTGAPRSPVVALQVRVRDHLAATRKPGEIVNQLALAREMELRPNQIYYVVRVLRLRGEFPYSMLDGRPPRWQGGTAHDHP